MLEVLVHIDRAHAPTDYVFVDATIPDDGLETLDIATLPPEWRAEPPPPQLRAVGDDWVREERSLGLRVPSAVVPEEFNVLVNPAHPRFPEIRILGTPRPAVLDPRLLT
jgi:RES domain-containing protein